MTTLENRPHTALLVIDVQNGVVGGAHARDEVVATIAGLVERARAERVPVVWVQHSDDDMAVDSEEWQIVSELARAGDEPSIRKNYGDSFEATELEGVLAGLRVGRLIVTGAQTDVCVRSTLHGAITRGYDTTLVSDAHTTEDLTAYGNPPPAGHRPHESVLEVPHRPGRTAGTVSAAEVSFASPPGSPPEG